MRTSVASTILSGGLLLVAASGNENATAPTKPDIVSPPVQLTQHAVAPKPREAIENPIAVVYCCNSTAAEKPGKSEVPSVRELEQFHSNTKAAISNSLGKPVRLFGSLGTDSPQSHR